MIRIIGIGSPFGDDAAGLEAARQLAANPPPDCEVIEADRPGAALIDLFDGADAVILIDAVRSGAIPGTIRDLDLLTLSSNAVRLISSHDLGIVQAVRLARALARLPPSGRVLAIEVIARCTTEVAGLSEAARRGVREAVKRVRCSVGPLREPMRSSDRPSRD